MIYIGYDTREEIAYRVAKKSAGKHATTPLVQSELRANGDYWRDIDSFASTEFSLTRFLVPHLNNYEGWALFVDCDVLFTADPQELFDLADDRYALMCVKHDYKPTATTKMDGQTQHVYPRKNWSSVMLFNCEHPSNIALTADLVNRETPQYLHRMSWLEDNEIGALPIEWNYLVGWYTKDQCTSPKLIHYTEGGPWFGIDCEYAAEWIKMRDSL